jgi:hypothetical protein
MQIREIQIGAVSKAYSSASSQFGLIFIMSSRMYVTHVSRHSGHVSLHDSIIPSDSRPEVNRRLLLEPAVFFNTELLRFVHRAARLCGCTHERIAASCRAPGPDWDFARPQAVYI